MSLPARSLFIPMLSLLLAAGCSPPPESPEPVRSVKLMTVGAAPLQSAHEFAADVRPRVEARLGFRVAGKVAKRHVEIGQRVKAGDLLAELDPVDLRLAMDAARTQVAAALAGVQGATTNRDLAEIELKRVRDLKAQNFVSSAELDRREIALKGAAAQLEQTQAQLQTARAQLALQQSQEGHARLLADAPGIVIAVDAEVGQVVGAGTPVVRLAHDGPRDVVFAVPEDKVGLVPMGSEVTVRLWSKQLSLAGRVREVAPAADPVTRTFGVRVAVDSKADLPLGTTMTAIPKALSSGGLAVIKIPTSALRQEGQKPAVWIYDDKTQTVTSRPVVVASADGNEVVITDGLAPGARIVATGVHVLTAGQRVNEYRPKVATTAGAAEAQPVQTVITKGAPPAAAASR